jgi:hypothetical protein
MEDLLNAARGEPSLIFPFRRNNPLVSRQFRLVDSRGVSFIRIRCYWIFRHTLVQ